MQQLMTPLSVRLPAAQVTRLRNLPRGTRSAFLREALAAALEARLHIPAGTEQADRGVLTQVFLLVPTDIRSKLMKYSKHAKLSSYAEAAINAAWTSDTPKTEGDTA